MQTFILFLESKSFNKKFLDQFGKYKFYLINADKFRSKNKDCEEFGNFAISPWFKEIPKNEIWIDNNSDKAEHKFFISNALTQMKIIDGGGSEHEAYSAGERIEKAYRKKSDHIKNKVPKKEIYIKKYCKIENITVWLVTGEIVRDYYKTDFVEGGNGPMDGNKKDAAYSWIPPNEIWIESTISPKEIPLIILHEFVENTVMRYKHLSYDKAHIIASKVEFAHRPDLFTKEDVENLTKDKVFKLIKVFC